MKKTLAGLVLAALCLALLCGCAVQAPESVVPPPSSEPSVSSEPPPAADPAEESLAALRRLAADQGAVCAAAYLGYAWDGKSIADFLAGEDAAIWLQRQPFLATVPPEAHVRQPGGQVFCIVPPAGGTVQVHIYTEEGVTPPLEKGQTALLYAGDDSPVLLMGNESDILPNLQVTVTAADGSTVAFAPTVSLRDGSFYPMGADGAVCDFTLIPTEF